MGAILARLARILLPALEALLLNFGKLFLRFYFWLKVARFGLFLVKVGVVLGLITAMASGIDALVQGLSASMPALLADGIGRILPDNFAACVSALVMAKFFVWAFSIKDRLVNLGGI
ncbi:DUF5455 family protein [Modicisalibacter tunisiensis]|uniref:DUF5455 family protein n=1 Tax=Modicisalibacter tunisiensis TaxID=390637 RepID=UPI001CC93098|nr:DUF5455 family protein [Modicisalibacter tunisiensis]MBZ9538924.1 DUF5455 family protein [Modicisalibacter tunisiensis]